MAFYNPYLAAPALAWLLVQAIKFTASALKKEISWRFLYRSGGMPSAHTATVTALATVALLDQGFSSPLFGIAAVLAAVVMYDSLGVRKASGDHSQALRMIISSLGSNKDEDLDNLHIRQLSGHEPTEVLAGIVLGGVVGSLVGYKFWHDEVVFLSSIPPKTEQIFLLLVFGFMLALALVLRWRLSKRYFSPTPSIKAVRKFFVSSLSTAGIIGLILVLAEDQAVTTLGARWLPYLLLSVTWLIYAFAYLEWLIFVPTRYQSEKAHLKQKRRKKAKRHR